MCGVTTFPGMTAAPPSQETIATYPGDGTSGFLTAEDAVESPFVPGDFVGIPNGTTAGREIFVYLDDPGHTGPAQVTIKQASLSAPSGPLQVKTVDNSTGTIGPYLTGGIIIPVQPLPEGVPISASVTLAGANGPVTHSWTFTTASAPNASVTVSGSSITVSSANPAGGLLRVFVPPDSGSYYILDQPITTGTSALATSNLPTETQLEACVSQPAANGYDPASICSQPFTISSGGNGGGGGGKTYIYRLGISLSGRRLGIFSVPPIALGRTIAVTAVYQRRYCHRHRCRSRVLATRHRTVLASGRSLRLLLPSVRHATRINVTVRLSTFSAGGNLFKFKTVTIAGLL